jgi:hypothetical protein
MKPYKYVLLKEKSSEYIGKYANRDIIDTKHSIDRFKDNDRFNNLASDDAFKSKVIDIVKHAISKIYKQYEDKEGNYGVHSKSTGIGLVIDYRDDDKYKDGYNDAIIITLLPIKKNHFFQKGTTKLIVEKQIEMLGKILYEQEHGEKVLKESNTCAVAKEGNFDIVFWEGKLHDYFPIDTYIDVD